jgi:hypothetical protein
MDPLGNQTNHPRATPDHHHQGRPSSQSLHVYHEALARNYYSQLSFSSTKLSVQPSREPLALDVTSQTSSMMMHETTCPPNIMGAHWHPSMQMLHIVPKKPAPTTVRPQKSTVHTVKSRSLAEPFDPELLSSKLNAVIAERKARAEQQQQQKKKKASAVTETRTKTKPQTEKPESDPRRPRRQVSGSKPKQTTSHSASTSTTTATTDGGSVAAYRHVPQVAASQFSRTTRTEDPHDRPLVHRLSRPAMKFHMEGPNASREMAELGPRSSPHDQAKALRKAQSVRERLYERNQFQHASALQTTHEEAESEALRFASRPQCRSFEAHVRPGLMDGAAAAEDKASRRVSTGSLLGWSVQQQRFSGGFDGAVVPEGSEPRPGSWDNHSPPPRGEHYELVAHPEEHRVDWTQSDEAVPRRAAVPVPAPRKQESKWDLKARFVNNFNKHSKEEKPAASGEKAPSPQSPKRGGFFGRFKR